MVNSCVAFGCTNRRTAGSGITFHRIPKDPTLREAWIQAIRRKDWNPSANTFLCSEHFKEDDFNKTYASHLVTLKKGVVPSIFKEFPSYLQKVQKTKKVPVKRPAPADSETTEFIADETCSNTEDSPVKKKLKVKLTKTSFQLKKAKDQVKVLQQTKRRLQKRLLSYKNILLELKNKNLIIDEYYELLKNMPEISKEINLRLKKKHNKYSPQLRSFALTLNFLSPKAYCYVRKQFDTGLPHPRTISKWYESLDASPGFCKEALAALKAKSSTSQYPVYCSLIVDEMAIRQHVEWNGEQYVGYIDIGTQLDGDERSVAKEVFVLLINCINSNWRLPVGYFFTAGLSGEQRASVILNCLRWLSEANINIVSLTCDGAVSNFSMMKHLGCSFELDNFKTFFLHPITQQPIYFFLDPCHALKLVRNTFGDKGVLIDYEHKIIQWEHIVNLNKLQEEEGLHLANKLKRHHVFWKKQQMKVNLAAQLFSDSVGDALQFCLEKEIHGFQDASGTIRFIKLLIGYSIF